MPKFTDYTEKQIPEDNDSLMIYDAAAKVNKHVLFSGFWKWIAKKLKEATLSDLQTTDKTVIGALNELNGKTKTFKIGIKADSEEELCKKIADTIIKNADNATLFVSWVDHFSVCVNVYYDRSEYFVYTVQTFDTFNRYICEYYKGNISIKK